eukprot:gnl/Spiro4/4206_TR2102_c0_g1_i1.p1 gnl/Spiro4/4206_TR2102_c0_g1~~gnl/Spiro4/4206_TR2102_c0_g1_i1.p1  ORF type:complete len:331 (-),score=51.87 gnl/Spiro4/4206_TR2102_c0_g1_i1:73-1026(-)
MTHVNLLDSHFHLWDLVARPNPFLPLEKAPVYVRTDFIADASTLSTLRLCAGVHVEALYTTDPVSETRWLAETQQGNQGIPFVIVAFADLASPDSAKVLECLKAHNEAGRGSVRGIRYILNHDPTWPHNPDPTLLTTNENFRNNFALLQEVNYSFDCHCNPHQLHSAAEFFARFPGVPVVINHMGCLKLPEGHPHSVVVQSALAVWRAGMQELATLPHVFVKLSMVSYIKPNWQDSAADTAWIKSLVQEVITMFGVSRCMFASNYPTDSTPLGGVPFSRLFDFYYDCTEGFSPAEREQLFHGTAFAFYRLSGPTLSL